MIHELLTEPNLSQQYWRVLLTVTLPMKLASSCQGRKSTKS